MQFYNEPNTGTWALHTAGKLTCDHFQEFYAVKFGADFEVILQHFFIAFGEDLAVHLLLNEAGVIGIQAHARQQSQHLRKKIKPSNQTTISKLQYISWVYVAEATP